MTEATWERPTPGPLETGATVAATSLIKANSHVAAWQTGWREDINGLRAVAVLPVVIFHLAQSLLRGGYVGVDIFFVISGYLIGRNILRLVEERRFSLAGFYEHRLRRIFPAYAAVLLFVLAVSLARDLPPTSRALGEALVAAVASVTNIYFWAVADYFGQPAESLPLLHTWSLSVEEQFYLLFPALIILLGRGTGLWLRPALLGLFVASLLFSIPGAFVYPAATFYLIPTRAWELLLGGLLAARMIPPPRGAVGRNLATAAGLVLIAGSMLVLTSYTPFPGLAALPPCLGAALIILGGETGGSVVARLLAWRPLAFIGLISYSLYLWHWPIMVLQRTELLFVDTRSKLIERGVVLVLSLIVATLSWWLIERPTRDRRLMPPRMLFAGCGAAALLLMGTGATLLVTDGLPARYAPPVAQLAGYLRYDPATQYRQGRCFLDRSEPFAGFDREACLPDSPGRPTYLLLGDSHAAHLHLGLSQVLDNANILQVTAVLCPATAPLQPVVGRACPELMELALNHLPRERRITKVWLSSAWHASRLEGTAGWRVAWLADLRQTVEAFRQRGVEAIIIGPSPEYRSALPRLLALEMMRNDPGLTQRELHPDPIALDHIMARFAAENDLPYVSLIDALCPGGICPGFAAPGVPLLFDASHYTDAGSLFVARRIADRLR